MNTCYAGHKYHERKVVPSIIGDMTIFNWNQYMNFPNYCTGQDGVSQTIDIVGYWDIDVLNTFKKILEKGDKRNVVMDIGCHIGWFSKVASDMGYKVEGFDGDLENLNVYKINASKSRGHLMWFDEKTMPVSDKIKNTMRKIELVKIDIEANEQYAITYLEPYLRRKWIKNIIMEISPCFNDTYPALVERLENYGFQAFELNGEPFNHDFNFHQKDLWFKQV